MKKKLTIMLTAVGISTLLLSGCGPKSNVSPASPEANVDPYPLDVCAVSGKKLEGLPSVYRFIHTVSPEVKIEILVAEESLKEKFDAEPDKYLKPVLESAGISLEPQPAPEAQ